MIELSFEDKFFQDIKNGKKTTIGKIDADLSGIKKGDTVIFFKDVGNKNDSSERISVKVKDIHKFNDVLSMLKKMKLKSILPRSKSYKDGEKVFEENYGERLKNAKFIAFTFDILDNIQIIPKVPKGTVLRVSVNSNSKEPIINFQPENEAELHMQERHKRLDKNSHMQQRHNRLDKHFMENNENSGPRIKKKKNAKSNGPQIKSKNNIANENDDNNENNSDLFGPRIKNKKDDKDSGPRIKNKKDDKDSGPRIKNKKNDNDSGPRIKNKKNDNDSGPRIKNKKDNDGNNGNHQSREFEMTIREPWFSLIENGQKQVEGRLYRGIVEEFRVNDTIRFINKWNGKEKSVIVKITKLTKYTNFGDLLFNEKLHRVLPGLPNIKCGILVYNKIYANFNEIKEFGTLAIELEVV